MRQTKVSFCLTKARVNVGEEEKGEKKRKKRKKKEKEKKTKQRYGFLGFCMESCIFWISRLFGMDYWTFIWISMVLGFLI